MCILKNMNKILKVEESTKWIIPRHLELLIERMGKQRFIPTNEGQVGERGFLPVECDLIFAVALVVALEEGFRLDDEFTSNGFDNRVFESLLHIQDFRSKDGTYTIELKLPQVVDIKFYLTVVFTLDDCSLLNVLSNEKGVIKHSSASLVAHGKYISTKNKGAAVFSNMSELCDSLRMPISIVKGDAMRSRGLNSPDIVGLPDDIKRIIFKKMKVCDFLSLCSVSTQLTQYLNEEDIWRYFLKRDFKVDPLPQLGAKATYQARLRSRPSTSTPHYQRYEEQFRTTSDFSFDVPPFPEQYS